MLIQPVRDGLAVRGVAYHQPAIFVARNDHVVDDTAALVADVAIAGLADHHVAQLTRAYLLQEFLSARSAKFQPAHMRNIEYRCGPARVQMFLDNAAIEQRHLPAGEVDHFCPELEMQLMEWRLKHCAITKLLLWAAAIPPI